MQILFQISRIIFHEYIKTGINHKTIEKEKRSNDYVLYMADFKLYDTSILFIDE